MRTMMPKKWTERVWRGDPNNGFTSYMEMLSYRLAQGSRLSTETLRSEVALFGISKTLLRVEPLMRFQDKKISVRPALTTVLPNL